MSLWPVEAKADLTPLVEAPCTALKKLGGLLFGKFTRAEDRRNILAAAQNQRDAQQITNGDMVYVDGELRPTLAPIHPLIALGQQQDLENLTGNLKIAMDILADTPDESVSETDVDPDWFARWRQGATVIGNTEMQTLWGRILAEEIKTPRAFSYKTLDVIKNITREHSEMFCKALPALITLLIPCTENCTFFNMVFYDSTILEDSGLITINSIVYRGKYNEATKVSTFTGKHITLSAQANKKPSDQHGISGLCLTSAGVEISKIADTTPPTAEHISFIVDVFADHSPNKEIYNCVRVHPTNDDGSYDAGIILHERNL